MNFEKINKPRENLLKEGKFKTLFKYLKLAILAIISLANTEILAQKNNSENDLILLNKTKPNTIEVKYTKEESASSVHDIEKFKEEILKYKDFGGYIACNIVSENPNEYQLNLIKNLQTKILSEIETQKFNSTSNLIKYINNAIDNNFSKNQNTIYLKDAFPEDPKIPAKGSFDCDSRSIMCLSILEKIGFSQDEISMYLLEGHAMLYIKSQNVFFETINNEIRDLTEDEKLQLTEINSFDKYYAWLLSKEGVWLANNHDANIFSDKNIDKNEMILAKERLMESIKINPNDITTNLNLLYVLKNSESEEKKLVEQISDNIVQTLLNNFYNTIEKKSDLIPQIIENSEIEKGNIENINELYNKNELLLNSLNNSYIIKKIEYLAEKLFYDFNIYDKAQEMYDILAKNYKNKNNWPLYSLYKGMVAKCYFAQGQYKKYLDLACGELYKVRIENLKNKDVGEYILNELNNENYTIMAAKIMSGEIIINNLNIDYFCKNYKDDILLGPFISGKLNWDASAIDAVEALKKWNGYNEMIKLINEWRGKNK